MSAPSSEPPLLEVRELCTEFAIRGSGRRVKAVNSVTLSIRRGEVLGLVGESGCGKSSLARSLMMLVRPSSGQVLLEGQDLTLLNEKALRSTRRRIQMVFQDPYASLNPRMNVYAILAEPITVHGLRKGAEVGARVRELIAMVGLPENALQKYPHEFSGGQRQRIAIARALALEPELLIADEPVSALDVSIQAQIINLLQELVKALNLSLLFIAHDLSVVRHLSDRVAVMYLGRIVEQGEAEAVIASPTHPYTRALVDAIPVPDPRRARAATPLQGDPPSPIDPPPGCPFHPRCPLAQPACQATVPQLAPHKSGKLLSCLRSAEL
jgi:oligopeptide/dipeptide ABC transporter ATP-binding protein